MRIIEVLQTQDYKEVTFEVKFLWWSWNKTYRKFPDNKILKFKYPDKYYFVGTFECMDINYLFSLPLQKKNKMRSMWKKNKSPKGYYFLNGDGYYIGTVVGEYKEDGEWWVSIENDKGQNVFHFPKSKLNADPMSDERFKEHQDALERKK